MARMKCTRQFIKDAVGCVDAVIFLTSVSDSLTIMDALKLYTEKSERGDESKERAKRMLEDMRGEE